MNNEAFAKRLKKILKDQNIKQYQLAEMVDVSDITVSRWINGHQIPDNSTIILLAMKLNIRKEYLQGLDEYMTDEEIIKEHQNLSQEEKLAICKQSANILAELSTKAKYNHIIQLINSKFFSEYDFTLINSKKHFYQFMDTEIRHAIELYMQHINSHQRKEN